MSRSIVFRRVTGAAWELPQQIYGSVWSSHAPPDVAHAQLWSGQELGWPTNQHTLPAVALRLREVARMRPSTENRENCRVISAGIGQ